MGWRRGASRVRTACKWFSKAPQIFERGLIREIAIRVWEIEEIVPISKMR
jgi:hypothetical protein